jgi:hypothetical protein
MEVKAAFDSFYHPQSNGAVEQENALIFTIIEKILKDQLKGKWAEELSRAVWSHNTSVSRATNFTPFKLLYELEPVTSEEIKFWSARTRLEAIYSPTEAESKDLVEPERMKVVVNLQAYQNKMRAWRDKKVREKTIKVGDLVLLWSPRTEASASWNWNGSNLIW